MLELYERMFKELFALPVIVGEKTPAERFAGAESSFSPEALLPDGKTVQVGTTHYLGTNFSRALGITFLNKEGKREYVHQTSWGIATRTIGAMIIAHGDDKGLVLPPQLARYQVVIVPIYNDKNKDEVLAEARNLKKKIKARVYVDDSEKTPGWKYNHWELKGVPLRIEYGPRDIKNKQVVLVKRNTGEKRVIKIKDLDVRKVLSEIHEEMYEKALKVLRSKIKKARTKGEIYDWISRGYAVKACWCGNPEHESKLKEDLGAKSANMPFGEKLFSKKCAFCGKEAKYVVIYSRQY